MRRRPSSPVLYEVFQRAGHVSSPLPEAERDPAGPVPRRLRLPIGFVWIAGGAVAVLLLVAYSIGFARGEASAADDYARRIDDAAQARSRIGNVREPGEPGGVRGGAQPAGLGSLRRPPSRATGDDRASTTGAAIPDGDGSSGDAGGGDRSDVERTVRAGDPRQPGYNYFVLIHPSRERGAEIVAFCRTAGMETALVEGDRGRWQVIALPGYPSGGSRRPEIAALRETIRRVGLRWKQQGSGNSDFSGFYADRFDG